MMLDKIVNACHYLLNNFPDAQECKQYIDDRLSQESQTLFKFGYFPDIPKINALLEIVGEDDLKQNKLYYSKFIEDAMAPRKINFSYFEEYPLVMPFKDAYGDVVAMVGRTLLSESERKEKKISKYKNTIFPKGNFLFGLYENKKNILEKNEIIVVEGQLDVIKAMEHGINNIVALGNSSMTAYQFSVIKRYTNNIRVVLDNDEAGVRGRELIRKKFGAGSTITDLYINAMYKDMDEYLRNNDGIRSLDDVQFQ